MKVFQINTVYGTGSTGRIVADLKHKVEKQGGQCMAAYGRGYTEEENTYKIGNRVDMYMHALLTRITDKTAFYSKRNTRRLIDKIIEFEPDVIHLHNLHGYYLNIEILFDFLKKYNKPVIWTLHDCWSYTGHCSYYTAAKCEQWKEHCKQCTQKTQYPASRVKDNCSDNFEQKRRIFTGVNNLTIVTPSRWLKKEVQQSFLKSYDVECIYNGIDLQTFQPRSSDLREKYEIGDKKVILCVANVWSDRKGLPKVIELSSKIDTARYAVVVIGLSKKQMTQMPETVIAIERTANIEELIRWYSLADIYFNTSTEETLGLTTIEALACGTPALVFNSTAIAETIDETCGIIMDDFERADIIDSIIEIIEDGGNVINDKNVGEFCIARAKEFELRKMEDAYLKLYMNKSV